jgi:hypothetical protein
MRYDPKHLRSIQALPDTRRITVFLRRNDYFIEGLLNACDVMINSIAIQIDKRVTPTGELLVGTNFFEQLRASSSAYLQDDYRNATEGDLVATFNSWNVYADQGYAPSERLPFVGPDGAYFLILATSNHPDHQVLLGSVAFILEGKP